MTNASTVFTIGHSNHSTRQFVNLLKARDVTALVDVRSQPFSRFKPDFNRQLIARVLKKHGIAYAFMGKELGGRPEDEACYKDGQVQYAVLAETEFFRTALQRLIKAAQTRRLVLMCAEAEPLVCHRTLLIGKSLRAAGVCVMHIHADGHVETQGEALKRLPPLLGMPFPDLLRPDEETIEDAITRQERRIAYVNEAKERQADED